MAEASGESALSHVTVLDISRSSAGAMCSLILAWLGATVTRVECYEEEGAADVCQTSGAEDDIRRWQIPSAAAQTVVVDLATSDARDMLADLATSADVLVEDWESSAAEQSGLNYAALRQRNDSLVSAHLSAFPEGSRWSAIPMNEGVAQATGGAMAATGEADQPPLLVGLELAATSAGLHAAMGILAALHQRDRTGSGQQISISLQESVANLSRALLGQFVSTGRTPVRTGNSAPGMVPCGLYPCAPGGPDDYVALLVWGGWPAMLKAIGREDLTGDDRFETLAARVRNAAEVDRMISERTREGSKTEIMDAFGRSGVPTGAVLTARDLIADRELWERRSLISLIAPGKPPVAIPGMPIRLADSPLPSALTMQPGEGAVGSGALAVPDSGKDSEVSSPPASAASRRASRFMHGPRGTSLSALDDVTVVDLTMAQAGPFCTQMLAYLGADVIKIERPDGGDYVRQVGSILNQASPAPTGVSNGFLFLNALKKSVVLDLKTAAGIEAVRRLVAKADIFVENLSPGAVERLGLGYEALRELNPRLIYAQLKGLAPGTRWGKFPAYDPVGQSAGGLMSVTGYEGGVPMRAGIHVADSGAGLHLAVGILAALNQRAVTGKGQRVEVNMQDVVMNFARRAFALEATGAALPARRGNRTLAPDAAPVGLYPCMPGGANDYCYIEASRSEQAWRELAHATGHAEWIGDARFLTPDARFRNRAELDERIAAWTAGHSKEEVMDILGNRGIPVGAVLTTHDLCAEATWRLNSMTTAPLVRGSDPAPVLGMPVRMSGSLHRVGPAPLLGEHTGEVLTEYIGPDVIDDISA